MKNFFAKSFEGSDIQTVIQKANTWIAENEVMVISFQHQVIPTPMVEFEKFDYHYVIVTYESDLPIA
jgi:hypothetical protein